MPNLFATSFIESVSMLLASRVLLVSDGQGSQSGGAFMHDSLGDLPRADSDKKTDRWLERSRLHSRAVLCLSICSETCWVQ